MAQVIISAQTLKNHVSPIFGPRNTPEGSTGLGMQRGQAHFLIIFIVFNKAFHKPLIQAMISHSIPLNFRQLQRLDLTKRLCSRRLPTITQESDNQSISLCGFKTPQTSNPLDTVQGGIL